MLAHRLSKDPSTNVLLGEAGGSVEGQLQQVPAAWPVILRADTD